MVAVSLTKKSVERVVRLFDRAPDALIRRMQNAFTRDGAEWHLKMAKRFTGSLSTRGNRKKKLHTRTGALFGSLGQRTIRTANNVVLRVFSAGNRYAITQEEGDTIEPKHAQHLWVPLPDNMTSTGVQRLTPRQAIAKGAFKHFSRKGNPIVSIESGNGIKTLFILRRRVVIPPRLGFFDTWDSLAKKRAVRHRRAVKLAFADARRGGLV